MVAASILAVYAWLGAGLVPKPAHHPHPRRGFGVRLAASESDAAGFIETVSGLRFRDEVVGDGALPKHGDILVVDYRGSLVSNGAEFDSSYSRGMPFSFELGKGRVIPGWDEGLATMRVGGKRTLLVPPSLAYGSREVGGGRIPANSELRFEIELKDVKSGALAQVSMKADVTLQNVVANLGLNPFTFFVILFLLLTVAPAFLPDESPLMYGEIPNPFESGTSLDAELSNFAGKAANSLPP